MKKLMRSRQNKMIAGICGGLGEYFGVDASLIRVMIAIIALFAHAMWILIALYIICWIIIPANS